MDDKRGSIRTPSAATSGCSDGLRDGPVAFVPARRGRRSCRKRVSRKSQVVDSLGAASMRRPWLLTIVINFNATAHAPPSNGAALCPRWPENMSVENANANDRSTPDPEISRWCANRNAPALTRLMAALPDSGHLESWVLREIEDPWTIAKSRTSRTYPSER